MILTMTCLEAKAPRPRLSWKGKTYQNPGNHLPLLTSTVTIAQNYQSRETVWQFSQFSHRQWQGATKIVFQEKAVHGPNKTKIFSATYLLYPQKIITTGQGIHHCLPPEQGRQKCTSTVFIDQHIDVFFKTSYDNGQVFISGYRMDHNGVKKRHWFQSLRRIDPRQTSPPKAKQ